MRDELIHYGVGSVTNGKYKIEIRVKNFPDDVDEFNKGDHLKVEGVLKFTRTIGFLKTKFQIIYGPNETPKFICSSITDGEYKL